MIKTDIDKAIVSPIGIFNVLNTHVSLLYNFSYSGIGKEYLSKHYHLFIILGVIVSHVL